MKPVIVIALSALTLAGSVAGAEARGFRLRSSSYAIPHRTTPFQDTATSRLPAIAALGFFDPRPAKTSIVTRSVMTTDGLADAGVDDGGPIPPMPPAPAAVAGKKPAEPWCPSGRIAGSGAGFCVIN